MSFEYLITPMCRTFNTILLTFGLLFFLQPLCAQKNNKKAELYYGKAFIWEMKENYKVAILYYDSALNISERDNSLSCKILHQKAECLRALKNYQLALENFKQCLKCGEDPYIALYEVADIFMKLDQLDSAHLHLSIAHRLDSTKSMTHYGFGKIEFEKNNYQEAITHFNSCIEIDPCNIHSYCDAYYLRAYCNFELGHFTSALSDIELHLKNEPNDFVAAGFKGKILFSLGEYEKSAQYYEYYLLRPHDDQDGVIMNMIGSCNTMLYQDNPNNDVLAQKAAYWYLKAAALGYSESYSNLARVYLLGEGLFQNIDSSYYWHRLAAEQEDEIAQYFLARLYEETYSPSLYDKTPHHWFIKSANNGYSKAMYHLGVNYYNGEVIQENLDSAKFWLNKAIKAGLKEASDTYAELFGK